MRERGNIRINQNKYKSVVQCVLKGFYAIGLNCENFQNEKNKKSFISHKNQRIIVQQIKVKDLRFQRLREFSQFLNIK